MALPAFACSRRLTTITTGSRLSSSRVRVAGLSCLSSLSLCSLLSLSLSHCHTRSLRVAVPTAPLHLGALCLSGSTHGSAAPSARERICNASAAGPLGPSPAPRSSPARSPLLYPWRPPPVASLPSAATPPLHPPLRWGKVPKPPPPLPSPLGLGFLGGGRWQAGLGHLPSLRRWVGPRGLRLYCCAHWTRCPPGPPSPSSSSSASGGV